MLVYFVCVIVYVCVIVCVYVRACVCVYWAPRKTREGQLFAALAALG